MSIPSPQQDAIVWAALNALIEGRRETIIGDCIAGSGKTFVAARIIAGALEAMPELAGQIAYFSFAKRNAQDMTAKLFERPGGSNGVEILTFHSAGLGQLAGADGRKPSLHHKRTQEILEDMDVPYNWRWVLAEVFAVIQDAGAGIVREDGAYWWPDDRELETLTVNADLDTRFPVTRRGPQTWGRVNGWLRELAKRATDMDGTVTYGDMVWLPLRLEQSGKLDNSTRGIRKYRLVIVDEYQDLNTVRRLFGNATAGVDTVLVFLGDKHQAIMGFTGADRRALESVKRSQGAVPITQLPLTWSFRCPPVIAKEARKFVPHFESAPIDWGTRGKVQRVAFSEADTPYGSVILCRNNRPLIDVFFHLLDRKVKVRFEGKDFAEKLLHKHNNFLKRTTAPQTIRDYRDQVYMEGRKRVDELLDMDPPKKWKAAVVRDEYATWLRLINYVTEVSDETLDFMLGPANLLGGAKHRHRDTHLVGTFLGHIAKISGDSEHSRKTHITLSTIHKAKGLEWDSVIWYGYNELHPSKFAKTAEEKEQERNLQYVAWTRTKDVMYLVPITDFGSVTADIDDADAVDFEEPQYGQLLLSASRGGGYDVNLEDEEVEALN